LLIARVAGKIPSDLAKWALKGLVLLDSLGVETGGRQKLRAGSSRRGARLAYACQRGGEIEILSDGAFHDGGELAVPETQPPAIEAGRWRRVFLAGRGDYETLRG
jgi:hypothetical protein